ncbi:MAG: LuxR C-terminal-related transcriptional regulator, partial [Chloroflexota bacterium]
MGKLAKREIETLELISLGYTNQEICDDLVIEMSTVKKYVQHIFKKLRAKDREAAVRHALRQNVIDGLSSHVPNNLYHSLSKFIGRQQELQQLDTLLLAPESRLITLLGMGGIGKTRLALQIAKGYALNHRLFRNGIFRIGLSTASTTTDLIQLIAKTIGLPIPESMIDEKALAHRLCGYLFDKKMLLIFENGERLVQANHLIQQILTTSPCIKIVATSQIKLDVYGEVILQLNGLSVSDQSQVDNLNAISPATELFIQAAQQHVCLPPSEQDYPTVGKICQQIQGHPLAIELAAAQLDALSLEQILSKLSNPLDLLSCTQLGRAARHQSMRAACAY